MCAALPNVARLWRCVALPQTHGIPRDHKGRYSVHGARPVTPPDSQPCCHRAIAAAVNTQNTNASYCAFKLDTRPSRPNESFVTPLFCWLSRSLTGTLFWQIGYTPFFLLLFDSYWYSWCITYCFVVIEFGTEKVVMLTPAMLLLYMTKNMFSFTLV